MAQLFIRGVPDFTQVRAEITKLQQEVASISAKPVRLSGTLESDLKGAATAANRAAGDVQRVVTTTNQLGNVTKKVTEYKDSILQTTKVIQANGKETQTVTKNYEKAAAAIKKATAEAEKKAAADEKATAAAKKYLLEQEKIAAKSAAVYQPTATQQRIEALTGVSGLNWEGKSARDSAMVFQQSFLNGSDKIAGKIKEVKKQSDLLGDSIFGVYKKMLLWQVMGTIVSKSIGAFRDALNVMKAVDDELVTVRKVTGATAAELEKLREEAYKTASAYGEAADEYLNSVSAFARAGYGEQASQLAELATKTKLVGDTNAETAQQFLLSVDAAYQYKGNIEKLTAVLDGANEIDNKYATSIEKIAEGLGTVAPVAAQAHVGIDELTAAIGTITAVTQRSGSEAARAFRALVLNIVGDTKTEIEEGVTWTTGEIAGLKDIIRTYSKAAYEAAEATGSVINPMEAIAGLSQSMKDGLLTEQELMETVSDIGGKLRTSQLLALIQNWDMYQSMLADYADAVGSADREIENALDSWTRKTQILSNKWSEFIQSFISTDLIKGVLDGFIGIMDVLNSDFGKFLTTTLAVSAGLVGVGTAITGISKAAAVLKGITAFFSPWSLVVGAVAAAFAVLWDNTKDYRKTLEDLNGDIEENTDKLKENKERIEEINNLGWHEKTAEILNEKAALEAENNELERQIEKLEKLSKRKAQNYLRDNGGISGRSGLTISGIGKQHAGAFDLESPVGKTFDTFEELRDYLGHHIPQAALMTREEIEAIGISIEESGAKEETLIKRADELSAALKDNRSNLENARQEYDELTVELNKLAEAHAIVEDGQTGAQEALDRLNQAYDYAKDYVKSYVSELVREKTAAGYSESMIYKLVKAEILLNEQNLDLSQQIGALMELATAAGGVASSIAMIGNVRQSDVERTISGMLQSGQARTYEEARKKALNNIYKSMFTDTGDRTPTGNGKTGTGGDGTGNDPELERLKGIVQLRKSELSLMQERGDDTAAQIAKMREIQAALHAQAEYMRKIGANQADINALSQEHWQITNKIKELQKALWQELEDAVNKKLEEAAEARDKQLNAIDKQIEALKAANEEEEKAAELEDKKASLIEKENNLLEKQKALQEAMAERTVRIYNAQSGQWEWGANQSNVKSAEDAVQAAQEAFDKAQEDLVKYEKELALQAEIDALERKKQLIEDTYNTLKDEWEKITDSLQEPTREIGEILRDIAANGLTGMKNQIDGVNDLLGKLNGFISGALGVEMPGMAGGAAGSGKDLPDGGGAYHFDFSKKSTSGWTEEEMREGFLPPQVSKTAAAISAISKGAGAILTAGGLGATGALVGALGKSAASTFTTNNRTSNDHYGNIYNVAGVQITKQQAEGLTLADLARDSRNLGIYKT